MESKLWVRTNGRMEIERKTKRFDNPSKHKSNGGYTMKKFVSKLFACLLVVVIAASIMCSSAFALYAPCKKDGCYKMRVATVYKGNIIKNLIMDCQSYTKYRPSETTGGIFVSWRRKEELPTGA